MMSDSEFTASVELLRRAKRGETECLHVILERYRDRLLLRIRLMMGSQARAVAESADFLHGVFASVLEDFDQFEVRDERSFLVWISQIARNGIRSHVRKKRERLLSTMLGESDDAAVVPTPLSAVELGEQAALLADALARLDEDQRKVIELRHFENRTFDSIGRELGRSANAAQLLHARVLARLSARMTAVDS